MARETRPYDGLQEFDFLESAAPAVIQYCNWYAEDGLFLPPEYEQDPAAWTQILRDIQAAMEMVLDSYGGLAIMHEKDAELMHNGIEKFYKYLKYLWK